MHMPNMVHGRLAPGKIVLRKIAPYANPNHNPNPYLGGICFGEIFRGGGVGNFPIMSEYNLIGFQLWLITARGGSRTTATSEMEYFVIIVNGWKPWTIITKHSILDGAAAQDPPLIAIC